MLAREGGAGGHDLGGSALEDDLAAVMAGAGTEVSLMRRWDSAAVVSNTSELLPEPDTPVKTVSRRLGSSTLTAFRLFSRAPWTRIRSWLSALIDPERGRARCRLDR